MSLHQGDVNFKILTQVSAIVVLIILSAIFISLVYGAAPAFQNFGFSFFVTERWSPVKEIFGALGPIVGTLITSFIAMLLAVPIGLGIAVFLTELCPPILRRPIGIAIELLAGIPSIIYGIWGLFVFAPFMQAHIYPGLSQLFAEHQFYLGAYLVTIPRIPGLADVFAGPSFANSVLTASIILAIMVLPFITAVSRDVFETVPVLLKESAYGIGCTTWEVIRSVVVPYTRVGLLGGVMLALGRALGETMAVTFVIGNDHNIHTSILASGTTISATIANEFAEADGLHTQSLTALGLVLFLITFIVLAFARLLLRRLEKSSGTK